MNQSQRIRYLGKPLVFLLCLVPLLVELGRIYGIGGTLGANPVEALQDYFGVWGLRFLALTLAVTPLRQLTGWNWLTRFRRMLGLFTFFYVALHFIVWLVLDQQLLLSAIAEDIIERPFITIGMLALLLLLALAVTSFAGVRRRMGPYWQKLHNSVYVVAVLGAWHFWWQVKNDISEPLIYVVIFTLLLLYRLYHKRRKRRFIAEPTGTANTL
jgi:sulfoxide reductase heme-binding subunit YedZ